MTQAIAAGALILCASVFLRVSCSLEKAIIVRNLTISAANASIVPFNGQLYEITKNQSHIHINSTDSNYEPCDIAIDPARDVFSSNVEVRSTEDEFFVMGIQSINKTQIDEYSINYQYNYTILRVDPIACTYQSVFIPEIIDDYKGDYDLPTVVGHRTGNDFFFPHLKSCAPCRVNSLGSISESTPQIPRENPSPRSSLFEHYRVQYVEPICAYFYVYDAHDYADNAQIIKLKLLDSSNFNTLKERNIDFSVDAVSKQKKSIGYLGVCTKVRDEHFADGNAYTEVRCDRLNSNLDTASTIRIHVGRRSADVSSVSYEFDKEGNSYISFAEYSKLRLHIHDKTGQLIKAIDAGEVDRRFDEHPNFDPNFFTPYADWDANGFLLNDQYCIVIEQSPRSFSTPLRQIRCIDVKEYVKR